MQASHGDVSADFAPGDLIHHKRFGYRGVVVDVDPLDML